jgi:hypothetical protein
MMRPRWYDLPLVWFAIQLGEFAFVAFAFRALVPDTWPAPAFVALAIACVVGLAVGNYRLIRWLRRRSDVSERSSN